MGRAHELTVSKRQGPYVPECGMRPSLIHPDKQVWHCAHNISCKECGKVLDVATPEDCPDRVTA